MAGISFVSPELGQLAVAFTVHSVRAEALARAAAHKTLLAIEAGAKVRAPVDTGFLRNSIQAKVYATQIGGEVVAHANYALFVEHGTSRMAPQPFMGPAADAAIPPFEQAMARIGAMEAGGL